MSNVSLNEAENEHTSGNLQVSKGLGHLESTSNPEMSAESTEQDLKRTTSKVNKISFIYLKKDKTLYDVKVDI